MARYDKVLSSLLAGQEIKVPKDFKLSSLRSHWTRSKQELPQFLLYKKDWKLTCAPVVDGYILKLSPIHLDFTFVETPDEKVSTTVGTDQEELPAQPRRSSWREDLLSSATSPEDS